MAMYCFISWIYHKLFHQSHIVEHLGLFLFLSKTEPLCTLDSALIIINSWSIIFHIPSPIPYSTFKRYSNYNS